MVNSPFVALNITATSRTLLPDPSCEKQANSIWQAIFGVMSLWAWISLEHLSEIEVQSNWNYQVAIPNEYTVQYIVGFLWYFTPLFGNTRISKRSIVSKTFTLSFPYLIWGYYKPISS
jgi:hypothetical protein